ncbi:MAG: hypothetical protein DRP56_11060 [Planctomycetota bacterium]|nr:MAG: hypothetical protein DRP56_11060 [Planctomycetota bacterium]
MRLILLTIVLLLTGLAWGIVGDFTGDDEVDIDDLQTFTADWLAADPNITDPNTDLNDSDAVNLVDFAIFAAHWGEGDTSDAPTAADVNAWCYAGESAAITLPAGDPDGDDLTLILTTPPSKGVLSGTPPNCIYSAWSDATAGVDVFSYKVNDGGLDSNVADVNVIVYRRPLDTIAFDARSSVVIPDSNTVNIDDSFTIVFWFKTKWPNGALMTKRAVSGGAGIDVTIEDGLPTVRLYDVNNVVYATQSIDRYDTGSWTVLEFSYNTAGGVQYNGDPSYRSALYLESLNADGFRGGLTTEVYEVLTALNCSNTADVIFGKLGIWMYYGSIDSFSNYDTAQNSFSMACIAIEGRSGEATPFSPAFYRRFLINEGTGTTTADTTDTYEGTLSNHGRTIWADEYYKINDQFKNRSRLRGIDGAMMLPNQRRAK